MENSLYHYCKANGMEYLLDQWNEEKNQDITPFTVARGSHTMAWWRCEKGHEWQAQVKSRVDGCACPFCANRKTIIGENDLASTHPAIAAKWHPTKNAELTPQKVTVGSRKKVWWRCEKGHEWQAVIYSRTSNGCPICSGKLIVPGINDLSSVFPDVTLQWHATKNGALKPDSVSPFSNKSVWWQCEKGHEWQAVIASRTRGRSCPYCSGVKVLEGFNDLATLEPQLAAQWHLTLNKDITPQMVTRGSNKRVWWQCAEGHVWKALIYSRTGRQGYGCPVCAGKVKVKKQKYYTEAFVIARYGGSSR